MRYVLVLLAAMTVAGPAVAQVSEERVRAAVEAVATTVTPVNFSNEAFLQGMLTELGAEGIAAVSAVSLPKNLDVRTRYRVVGVVQGPTRRFVRQASEAVRTGKPWASIEWTPEVVVSLAPESIQVPDIQNVILMRDGTVIQPLRSTITLMTLKSGAGATVTRYAGEVFYPREAFAQGAPVSMTLIPREGDNIPVELTDDDLERLQ